jgi:hypothetical protein
MTEDYIDTFSTTLDSVPLTVRYGVDNEDGYVYLIDVMTQSDDDLMGIISEDAIAELKQQAKRAFAKYVKEENDAALEARAEDKND